MRAEHGQTAESVAEEKRVNKYGARKTWVDGIQFDSKREAERWCELKLTERAGLISDLRRQVRIELIPKVGKHRARYYVADFQYLNNETGRMVVEDVKGVHTQTYELKKAIIRWRYGIEITET